MIGSNLKVELVRRNVKISDIARSLQERGYRYTPNTLSNRIREGKLNFIVVEEIFDIMGCKLVIESKDKKVG